MTKNVGNPDRIARGIGALAALWAASAVGFGSVGGILLIVVAIVLGATAAVGSCPIYRLVGMNTCPVPKS